MGSLSFPLTLAALVASVSLLGWLATSAVSAVARLRSGQPQSFRMPWWGVTGLGITTLLILYENGEAESAGLLVGLVLLLGGLLMGAAARFSLLGQYRWWNSEAPLPLPRDPAKRRAHVKAMNNPALDRLMERLEPVPMSEPTPAEGHVDPGAYDGHGDYVEEARKQASAGPLAPLVKYNLDVPGPVWKALSLAHTLVGFGVALLVGYRLVLWVRENVHGELGFGGLAVLLVIFVVALLAAVLFHVATGLVLHQAPRWTVLVGMDLAAVLVIWFGIALPMQRAEEAEARARQQAAAQREAELRQENKQRQWQEGLRAQGAHGAPGVVPPMLDVQDEGATVRITNKSPKKLYVALARVRPRPDTAGGWEGCRMMAHPSTQWTYERWNRSLRKSYRVDAGATLAFEIDRSCPAGFGAAPVEYRVGGMSQPVAWWSDSALSAPVQGYHLEPDR